MMKLSTMQAVVATVDDQWESALANELLLSWEHDVGCPKYWRASTNFIFFFKRLGRDHVLRFNHASERTAEVIQAEIDYVNALAEAGMRVAQPVRSIVGKQVESIATALGLFHVVVFEALPGKQFDLQELTPDQLVHWGQALGELHRAATRYTQPGRPRWQDQLMPILLSNDAVSVRQALRILGTQAQPHHAPALVAFIQRTEDATQLHDAAAALLMLQKRQVNLLQPLIDYMLSHAIDSEKREWVAYSLTHEYPTLPGTWHERLSRAFCIVLSDVNESPSLRAQAAEGLAEIYEMYVREHGRTRQYRRTGELLIQILRDPAPEVRFWTCFALGKMHYRQALRALNTLANIDLATHGPWWSIGEEAADAIDWIKGRPSPERELRRDISESAPEP